MPVVLVKVFGKFQVVGDDGVEAPFRTKRAAEVVALLAMQPAGKFDRRRLADAIWPESLPSEQLQSLRPALHYAKSAIGAALHVDDRSGLVTLDAESEWQGARKLELRIAAEVDIADRVMLLHALANLVREPLFDSWDRHWMEPFRQRHQSLSCRVHYGLAEIMGSKGESEMALEHIQVVRSLTPLDEAALKLQLQLLGKLDHLSEARQVYKEYKASLQRVGSEDVSADVAMVASKTFARGYAENRTRIVSSVQLEFVQELLEVLSEEAPERLLPLLAAQQVNWAVVSHGPELKPILETVLARTGGWPPDRADVAKRLLQYYDQEGEFQHMRKLASQLLGSPRTSDQVAALNYMAIEASNSGNGEEAHKRYEEATALCESEGLPYLAAVSRANFGLSELSNLRLDAAQRLLESAIDELSSVGEPNARYSIAHCLATVAHIEYLKGNFETALNRSEDWAKLALLEDAVRKDSAGLAVVSLAFAHQAHPLAVFHAIKALDAALSSRQKVKMHASALIVCAAARLLGLEEAAQDAARELLAWTYSFRAELCPLDTRLYADAGLSIEAETVESPTSLPKILVNLREAFELVLHD